MQEKISSTGRRLIELLVFLVLFMFLSNNLLNVLNIKKGDEGLYPRLYSVYSGHYRNADVVFAGSSHAGQMIGRQLWRDHGIAAFTIADDSQPVDIMYHQMKEYLKFHKPKIFLVETAIIPDDSIDEPDTEYSGRTANDAYFRYSLNYAALIAEQIKNYNIPIKDEGIQLLLKWPLMHDRYKKLTRDDYVMEQPYINTTFDPLYSVPDEEVEIVPTDERAEISSLGADYLNRIIRLCRQNKVQLILFHTPYPAHEVSMAQQNTLSDIAAKEGIPFLDFNYLLDEIDFNIQEDLARDLNHLNYYGSSKVTGYIGDYLKANYDLDDHRNTPGYEDWDKDLKAWENAPIIQEMREVTDIMAYSDVLKKYAKDYVVIMSLCGNYPIGEEPVRSMVDSAAPGTDFFEKGGAMVIDHGEICFYSDGAPFYLFTHKYGDADIVVDRKLPNEEYAALLPKENDNDGIEIRLDQYAKVLNGMNITVFDDFTGEVIDSVGIDVYQSLDTLFRTKVVYE
ncbi:MAG: hypothetical protein K6E91_06100 [Butyrivibrio sp.]|nr:hypothetical protein [Butyrivibrio sp.]